MDRTQCVSKLYRTTLKQCNQPKLMSQIFCHPDAVPKEKAAFSPCKSLKLMLGRGFIKHVSSGVFSLMPLAVRALEKLCNLTDTVMETVNGQKVLFPTLIQDSLMKKTGRWDGNDNLFKLKDRHSFHYCLGPTHEEVATNLFSKIHVSYKSLPLRLYQISTKFRDEMNPKLGLLRGREFIMKDMYTFDTSEDNAQVTYDSVCEAYHRLFQLLEIEPLKVRGSSGDIGGKSSHEFHFASTVGEDQVYHCPMCKSGINAELASEETLKCGICNVPLVKENAIEVGHAFLLGTTYSLPFDAMYDSMNNTPEILQMGCYGLGLSRILASSVECMSSSDNIRWPFLIAPFYVSVIPPKKGSKEESVRPFADSLAQSLCMIDWLSSNVILDERTHMTIGRRVQDASAIGIPYIAVVSSSALKEVPLIEVIDVHNSQTLFLSHKETIEFFRNKFVL